MTDRAKQLYQIAEEKINSINEKLRRLNKDYHPIDENDEFYDDSNVWEELGDETLDNFYCLLESFDDDYLNMFNISFDESTIEQDEFGEWERDPCIILASKNIPCLYINTACCGYYINGDGESCDPTENCMPAAQALVAKYKKQYEAYLTECRLCQEGK